MIFIASLLIALSVGCGAMALVKGQQSQTLLKKRMVDASVGSIRLPFEIDLDLPEDLRASLEVSYDEIQSDPHLRNLYLAGIRHKKYVKLFAFLHKAKFGLPVALMLLYALDGSLQGGELLKALQVTFLLHFGLVMTVRILKQKRQKHITRTLPQILDLLVIGVESGLNFTAAMERVLKEMDRKNPLVREFSVMHYEYLSGLGLSEASKRMEKRCGVDDVTLVLNGIVQSEEMGASMGRALRIQAIDIRDKYRQRIREKALKIPVKILFPVALIFVSLMTTTLGPSLFQLITALGGSGLVDGFSSPITESK